MSQCPMCFSKLVDNRCGLCGYSGEPLTETVPAATSSQPAASESAVAAGSVAESKPPTAEQRLVLGAMLRSPAATLVGSDRFRVATVGGVEVDLATVRAIENAGWIAPAGRLQGAIGWRLTRAGQAWAMSRAQLEMLQGMRAGKTFHDKGSVAGGHFDGEPNRRVPFHEIAVALALAWVAPVPGTTELDQDSQVQRRELQACPTGLTALSLHETGMSKG